jgi:hypothetical protein
VTTINFIAAKITKKYVENLILVAMINKNGGKIKGCHDNYKIIWKK